VIEIEITCPHGQMKLSIDDAQKLVDEISEKIKDARISGGPLTSFMADPAYVSRQELFQFFRQYVDERFVTRRIGRLFAAIVKAEIYGERDGRSRLPMGVICGRCKSPVSNALCGAYVHGGHRYYRTEWGYLISFDALKRHSSEFMPGGSHELSGPVLESFRILAGNLE
jgi:hypothetical protein